MPFDITSAIKTVRTRSDMWVKLMGKTLAEYLKPLGWSADELSIEADEAIAAYTAGEGLAILRMFEVSDDAVAIAVVGSILDHHEPGQFDALVELADVLAA